MALEPLTMGLYPEIQEQIQQNPMIIDIYKSKINAALTSAGTEAERQGLVAPGGGYAKAMQQAYEKPQVFRSLIDGQQ
jgi:hypothetical protein